MEGEKYNISSFGKLVCQPLKKLISAAGSDTYYPFRSVNPILIDLSILLSDDLKN